jgi:hypothetical protein
MVYHTQKVMYHTFMGSHIGSHECDIPCDMNAS